MGVGPAWFEIARRDILIAYRRRAEAANPLLFLLIVVALFPLGVGPAPEDLSGIAPGVVWVAALLASLLSTDMLFRSDFDDGSLEQIARSPAPLYATALDTLSLPKIPHTGSITSLRPPCGLCCSRCSRVRSR